MPKNKALKNNNAGFPDAAKRKGFFSSLYIKLIASVLAVLVVALVVINIIIISTIGNSMIYQRKKTDKKTVIEAAGEVGIYFSRGDWRSLQEYCRQYGTDNDCRVMVFDTDGNVAADSYSEFGGLKLNIKEIQDCLQVGMSTSSGMYQLGADNRSNPALNATQTQQWVIYSASEIEYEDELLGAILIIASVQELVDEIDELSLKIVLISVGVGIAVSLVLILLMRKYFAPLKSVTGAIVDMAKGKFKVRAETGKGNDELSELAVAFNAMCAKMETLEESRNKFVSDASHEMKTPLATMKILVDSLINQPELDPAITKEFMGDISHEIDRLTYLINDLLALVRMDKPPKEPDEVPIQITDLIDKVRHKLQPIAAMKGIIISYITDGDFTVVGDAMKLQQAFSNLLDNAIKYSPEDTTITVSVGRDAKNAIITVEDQGIGIAPEEQKKIFERFYRVDKARSRETGGTGLGLSIVDSIVRQHNGTISVKSRLGEGSVFTVTLPLQTVKNPNSN